MININRLRNIAAVILILSALIMLTACGATMQTVEVVVPVPCLATEPARPVMPTDMLMPGADLDRFTQAAIAEIERREGYESKLVAALRSCITPLSQDAP